MQEHDPLHRMEELERQLEDIHRRMSREPRMAEETPQEYTPEVAPRNATVASVFEKEVSPYERIEELERQLNQKPGWIFTLLWPVAVSMSVWFLLPLLTQSYVLLEPNQVVSSALERGQQIPADAENVDVNDPSKVADKVFDLFDRMMELEAQKKEFGLEDSLLTQEKPHVTNAAPARTRKTPVDQAATPESDAEKPPAGENSAPEPSTRHRKTPE